MEVNAMRRSRLPRGGANIFQTIRAKRAEAEAQGVALLDLSIGEPKGPALLSARRAAQTAIMSEAEAMHAYQYNASPGVPGFAERFVKAHVSGALAGQDVAYLPIPGIKPMLGLLPLACGCAQRPVAVATMTAPGYPIPADWCAYHPYVRHQALPTTAENGFRFPPSALRAATHLAMLNYPHNPSGQIATKDWLRDLCAHCQQHDIRLFNDAAYAILSYTDESATLCEVAADFPDLSWAEAFTAAKLIANGTGWHVGAMVVSPDFIADVNEVKGKTDAGFVAPMAAGVIAALETDQEGIVQCRERYRRRLGVLIDLMRGHGMQLAIEPRAGFFTLWRAPRYAFGQRLESAEAFNFLMIRETGVVGVHFPGYLRYAVCADVEAMAEQLSDAFERAQVSYGD
jgi:aspartate/methionine/tyrosine aminotransferase